MDQCAFYPTVAELSGEHVWDRWLSKVYAKEVNLKKFRLVEYDSGGSELESKTTQQINRKARVVCEPCNNGWMSVLTNETRSVAKDMIVRGSEIKLVPTDLSTLAQFAFLKSVVIDHLAVGRQPFWPTSDRYAFRTKRLIPAGVQVWISSYFHTHAEGHVWSGYAQPKDAGFVGLEFHSFTYHTGCLVLQVMSKRWSKLSRRREVVPTFRQNAYWDPVTVDIWPVYSLPIKWPLPKVLGPLVLSPQFRDRWLTLRTDRVPRSQRPKRDGFR